MIDNSSTIESTAPASQLPVNAGKTANKVNASAVAQTENVKAEQIVTQAKEVQNTQSKSVKPEEIAQVVDNLNSFVKLMKRNISFHVDKDSNKVVISVVDADTKELIRQIPSEEALKLLKRMDEAVGLLFNQKV